MPTLYLIDKINTYMFYDFSPSGQCRIMCNHTVTNVEHKFDFEKLMADAIPFGFICKTVTKDDILD